MVAFGLNRLFVSLPRNDEQTQPASLDLATHDQYHGQIDGPIRTRQFNEPMKFLDWVYLGDDH